MASVARPSSSPARLDRIVGVFLLLGAIAYASFIYRHGSPYAGGADSSGYFNSARLLDQHKFFTAARTLADHDPASFSKRTFQPLGFEMDENLPRMAPTYPLGLPLHLLAAAKLAGWSRAALVVNVFIALGSGVVLWLLARHFNFSRSWAAFAVAWLWLSPLMVFSVLQPMSDSPAMFWSLVVLYTAIRSREGHLWCVACGIALSLAVLVRPSNALLIFPVLMGVSVRPGPLLCLILGGIPGATFLGYYNYHVYGGVLTTGYGDVRSAFGLSFAAGSFENICRWLPDLLSPLVCVAFVLPFFKGRWSRDALILVVWTGLLIGFYLFYSYTGKFWWYLRFILPAFPLLILGAIAVLRKIPQPASRLRSVVLLSLLALSLAWEIRLSRHLHPVWIADDEQTYALSSEWIEKNLPSSSAIACMQLSGAFYYYTDFLLIRWDKVEPAYVGALLNVLHDQQRPIYAVLYEFETKDALARFGGDWNKITTVGKATVWQRKTDAPL